MINEAAVNEIPNQQAVFDRISIWYDMLNRMISLGMDQFWRKRAAELLLNRGPLKVLDLACGTGDQILTLFNLKLPITSVCGVDTSEKMLEIAQRKMNGAGINRQVFLEKSDAGTVRYKDDFFDAVTLSFGISCESDAQRFMKEAWRVVKPDGPLVILEIASPRSCKFRGMYTFYMKHIAPFMGGLISGASGAYKTIRNTLDNVPDNDQLRSMMKASGFHKLITISLAFGAANIFIGKKRIT